MQVLCKLSNTMSDVRCKICGQGFLVYWSRTSREEREATRRNVLAALEEHHGATLTHHAHPRSEFDITDWAGIAELSDAALPGGAEALAARD